MSPHRQPAPDSPPEADGVCDLCKTPGPVTRYRIDQTPTATTRTVSRTASLCVRCRLPLENLLRVIPVKRVRDPVPLVGTLTPGGNIKKSVLKQLGLE